MKTIKAECTNCHAQFGVALLDLMPIPPLPVVRPVKCPHCGTLASPYPRVSAPVLIPTVLMVTAISFILSGGSVRGWEFVVMALAFSVFSLPYSVALSAQLAGKIQLIKPRPILKRTIIEKIVMYAVIPSLISAYLLAKLISWGVR